jgi:hypothetical protein
MRHTFARGIEKMPLPGSGPDIERGAAPNPAGDLSLLRKLDRQRADIGLAKGEDVGAGIFDHADLQQDGTRKRIGRRLEAFRSYAQRVAPGLQGPGEAGTRFAHLHGEVAQSHRSVLDMQLALQERFKNQNCDKSQSMPDLKIGALAAQTGTNAPTIRYKTSGCYAALIGGREGSGCTATLTLSG